MVVVVPAAGAVVEVVGAVVVVVTGADVPLMTCWSAWTVDVGTWGSDALDGPNPRVINWLLRNLRLAGAEVEAPPYCLLPFRIHQRARTTPTWPASGVPAAHFWPFL